MADSFKFETYAGNQRVLTFYLRRWNDPDPWDVSDATQILLECTDPDILDINPIAADPDAPGADWSVGVVVVTITEGDVTSKVGTWRAGLTLFIGGEEVTYESGVIEVLPRPGFMG